MNCDFYALGDDCRAVLDFVFAQEGWVLYELSSRFDERVRAFRSTAEITRAFRIGRTDAHFQLHSPEMGARPEFRRIDLNASTGASFRYATEGWGLIQLYFGSVDADRVLRNSHTNHNSPTRAAAWASVVNDGASPNAWNWTGVQQTSGKLVRFIRKSAVAKRASRPILYQAFEQLRAGKLELDRSSARIEEIATKRRRA